MLCGRSYWRQYPIILLWQLEAFARCLFEFQSSPGKVGNFTSPDYPSLYPDHLECYYQFRGGAYETLRLTFLSFDLEPPFSKGCLTDYIDISTITSNNDKELIGRFCGQEVPSYIFSMHPNAEIIFKTNHALQFKGFHGQYEFRDEKFIPPPPSTPGITDCGGTMSGVGGVITSPGYPDTFPKDIECVWLIRVEHDLHIYFRILELQLIGNIANCPEAELAVYDGYSSFTVNPNLLLKYCGDLKYYKNLDDQTKLSERNRLFVRFKTTALPPKRSDSSVIVGFKIMWTAVDFRESGNCVQFICQNSQYCMKSASSTKCLERRHYCIDHSLVCNGLPNCSDTDESDEDKCNLPLYLGGGGVLALILLIALAVFFSCRHRRSKLKLEEQNHQTHGVNMQLRQLEHSPSCSIRQAENLYYQPSNRDHMLIPPSSVEGNCSVHHPHYEVIMNNKHRHILSDV